MALNSESVETAYVIIEVVNSGRASVEFESDLEVCFEVCFYWPKEHQISSLFQN